jgi:hypothetical protein
MVATKQPAEQGQGHGKAAPQFPPGLQHYQSYLNPAANLPDPPDVLHRYQQVLRWPLDGNAKYGDCSMAAAAHAIHAWNIATSQSHPVPDTDEVLKEYFRLTKGADIPLVEAEVLKHWHRSGLWGHRILGYTPISLTDIHLIKQAVYLYGLVFVGVKLTNSAEHQWKQKKEWSLQRGWKSEAIIGGHAVPVIGYDKDSFYVVTWGRVQKLSLAWWHAYGDEAWAIFPIQLEEAGGCDHLNLDQLHADLKRI